MNRLPDRVVLFAIVWLAFAAGMPAAGPAAEEPSAACQLGAAEGFRRYRPGSWGVVVAEVTNPTDEAAELKAVVYFSEDPTLQYGREIWVPANSLLHSSCPIRIPGSVGPKQGHVDVVSVPIDQSDKSDKLGVSHSELMDRSRPLLVDHGEIAAGILGDFENPYPLGDEGPIHTRPKPLPGPPDDPVYEVVLAAKYSQGFSRRLSVLNARDLPASSAAIDALDVLVLCSDRLAEDPNGTAMVRDWVLGGGHLWVMLDEVEGDSVSAILGETFSSTIVDRVERTELRIDDVRADAQREDSVLLEVDEPITFARVLPEGVTVTAEVDGWPASFWQPLGSGRVVYTTLGPKAWIRSATEEDVPKGADGNEIFQVARGPLARTAELCFRRKTAEASDAAGIEPFLTKQIGYRILDKETVALVLTLFCGLLCATGVWFWRAGRAGRLLWAAPLLAAATTLLFLGVAVTARRAVPPTVALWRRVVLEPGLATGQSHGLAALYNPEPCDAEIGAKRGGLLLPDMSAMRGQRRRMVWTDERAWHWEGLTLPPGVRYAPLRRMVPLEETVDCRARFGASGLQGAFTLGRFEELSDAVIAVPGEPETVVKMNEDGSFLAGPGDVAALGEFMSGTWLTDVQQRRRDVYRRLLGDRVNRTFVNQPTLFAWAESVDGGFVFPQTKRLESALVSIPVRIERSPAGSEVMVPSSFVEYGVVSGPDGRQTGAYSSLTGEWGELKSAVEAWVRFEMPESILPVELSRAVVLLNIRAPSRTVEILTPSGAEPEAIRELVHPIGAYRVVLDQAEHLELDDEGGLKIAIRVGEDESADPSDVMAQAAWQIESLRMEVAGTVRGE